MIIMITTGQDSGVIVDQALTFFMTVMVTIVMMTRIRTVKSKSVKSLNLELCKSKSVNNASA